MNRPYHAAEFFVLGGSTPDELRDRVETFQPLGVFLTSKFRGVPHPEIRDMILELRGLRGDALLVTTDNEGGFASWIVEHYPSPEDWTHMPFPRYVQQVHEMAARLRAVGVDWNFAPVVDLAVRRENAVIRGKKRSFGAHPHTVALYARVFVEAHRRAGVATTAKHFLAQARTKEDPHQEVSYVEASLEEIADDLFPYEVLFDAGVDSVMAAHMVFQKEDPEHMVVFSPFFLQTLLRDRLGFSGVVITDDLTMGAVTHQMPPEEATVEAFKAGNDVLLICWQREVQEAALDRFQQAIRTGEIPTSRLAESRARIQALIERVRARHALKDRLS